MLISVSWGWYKEWETEERKMKGFWLKQKADLCNFVICFLSWKSILKTLWIRCFECSGSHAVTYHGRSFSICCYSLLSFLLLNAIDASCSASLQFPLCFDLSDGRAGISSMVDGVALSLPQAYGIWAQMFHFSSRQD